LAAVAAADAQLSLVVLAMPLLLPPLLAVRLACLTL
jgi:hypothetical protein